MRVLCTPVGFHRLEHYRFRVDIDLKRAEVEGAHAAVLTLGGQDAWSPDDEPEDGNGGERQQQ